MNERRSSRLGRVPSDIRKVIEGAGLLIASKTIGRSWRRDLSGLVFVATTGRSGTMTLQRIFSTVPSSVSVHEAYPVLAGRYTALYNDGNEAPLRRSFYLRKVPEILHAARGHRWYADTSHVFIKGFAEFAVREFGDRLRVVHLVRDADAVASSYYHLGAIPGREREYAWLLNPAASRNLIPLGPELNGGGRFDHAYYRCLWYWYETEARAGRFHRDHPEVPFYRIETPQLNSLDAVSKMFTALDLPITPELEQVVGVRANASKRRPNIPEDVKPRDLEAFHVMCRERLGAI